MPPAASNAPPPMMVNWLPDPPCPRPGDPARNTSSQCRREPAPAIDRLLFIVPLPTTTLKLPGRPASTAPLDIPNEAPPLLFPTVRMASAPKFRELVAMSPLELIWARAGPAAAKIGRASCKGKGEESV